MFVVKTNHKWIVLLIGILVLIPRAYAISVPDLTTMVNKLSANLSPVIDLVAAVSYVLGFFFVISGLLGLKMIGQAQGGAGGQGVGGQLLKLVVGIFLLFLPRVLEMSRWTLWGVGSAQDSIFQYKAQGALLDPVLKASILMIKLLGFIAITKGFVLLSRSGHGQMHMGERTTGRAFVYIFSGILAVHIVGTINVIMNSLGIVF